MKPTWRGKSENFKIIHNVYLNLSSSICFIKDFVKKFDAELDCYGVFLQLKPEKSFVGNDLCKGCN